MNASVTQGTTHDVDEVALPELCRGDVDGNAHRWKTVALPRADLPARLPHDPLPNRYDQPALLRQWYEVIGRDETALWVMPAKQCLGAAKLSRSRVDLGLIVQLELRALKGLMQVAFESDPFLGQGVHVGREALHGLAATLFCDIHGGIC